MYPKNNASPERIAIGPVVQISDGAVQASGVSVKVKPQGGTASAGGGTVSYEEGVVGYVPTQAETNYTSFQVIAYKTGCIPAAVTVVTTASSTPGIAIVPDTQKVDLNTVKTQAITCAAGVTILASVGTAATATAQSRDLTDAVLATAIWNAATATYGSAGSYGLLVESANAIVVDWTDGGRLDLLIDGVKTKTDGLNFTGADVKATLDGEEVTPTTASKSGYALSATGLDLVVKLKALLDGTPSGSVVDDNDPDPLATAFETDLAEVSNDHYNGAFCVFYSGALAGQSRKISDYDGTTKVLTVAVAFTEAPAAGDDFLIIGRSE